MTDTQEDDAEPQQSATVFVAHVTVHLSSGDSFELLPFVDAYDVKSQVTDLLEDWAKSGYLVRGGHIYPWHQVKLVEATSVTEVARSESERRLMDWQTLDLAHLQQSFWKIKQPREKRRDNEQKNE